MSAPSPDDPPTMPTMVSRLPKFGSRTKSVSPLNSTQTATANSSTRLTNGFYHHPGPAGLSGIYAAPPTTAKQNGFLRVPISFSMKWKKENEAVEDATDDGEREQKGGKNTHQYYSQQPQGAMVAPQCDNKKLTVTSARKGRGFGSPVTSLSSLSQQYSPKALAVSKGGFPGSKAGQPASGPASRNKQATVGSSGSKPWSGTNGSLRQPQSFTRLGASRPGSSPSSRSGSPLQKKPPASRCHSSETLGSVPSVQLTDSDRLRSRSFTQVRQQASPTLTPPSSLPRQPAHRSYSINRRDVKDLTPSSAQVPPRGAVTKSSGTSRTPEGGDKGLKLQSSAPPARTAGAIPTLLPPSSLKKPLLPNFGSASKHSGISYKLSRPSVNKQYRPLRVTPNHVSSGYQEVNQGRVEQRNSVETLSMIEHSPESTPDTTGAEGLTTEAVSQCEVSVVGETLEDMSLSSNSSLDKNDTSQEYMDDFDNLGNGGVNILLLSSKNDEDDSGLDQSCAKFDDDVSVNGVTKPAGLCFLDAGMEWTGMRLNGEQRERRLSQHQRRSSQLDYHEQGGSSLDLSPSDSCGSGGTYMWDEEGLEPLRGAATTSNSNTTHHIGSFDSDLNSIDLLNNLESCDLDDDDLMLDADVSEDASLHSDGDGISHMAQWRRRQLCWGTQDVHNDNNSDHQSYKLGDAGDKTTGACRDIDLILDLCPPRSPNLPSVNSSLGVDVEELAEDCCAVRSQLEHLQRLLLQEEDMDEDTLTTDTLSPDATDSSNSCNTQVQALLQEVQQLREELRSRDQTILQLTRQLTDPAVTTRCRCQETTRTTDQHTQTSLKERESVASQTPWKEHAPQILQSSSGSHQGSLTSPTPAPAPPPAEPRPSQPHLCTDDSPDSPHGLATQGGKDGTQERRGASTRSLQQPSKLRLFLSQNPSSVAMVTKGRCSKQQPQDPEKSSLYGEKMVALTSGSSRLPKPLIH